MSTPATTKRPSFRYYFRRHIALPQEHGAWIFILSPLLIGLFAAESWNTNTFYIIVASMTAFLIRQPVIILVKVFSGRRSKRDLPASVFWVVVYGALGTASVVGLILEGFGYLLYLTIPGIPVFLWHLYLISQRSERRQMAMELVGSGVLALAAPAAFWVGKGNPDPIGWRLWILIWCQTATSIVYAYLRLEQRNLKDNPDPKRVKSLERRAVLYASFNVFFVLVLSIGDFLPFWLFVPYALQWAEVLWGVINPSVEAKPTQIGIRQLIVSSLFTILFIIAWRV